MALPTPLAVSWTTHTLYTANGTSILWDASQAQFVRLENSTTSDVLVKASTQLAFTGEEIEYIATFDDEVFVLTRQATGAQWTRPWKRRAGPTEMSDLYDSPHPLFTYVVRAFSADGTVQMGCPLHIEQPGVDGLIRAGPHRVIVKIIGQQCFASMWLAPTLEHGEWVPVYHELTWDPDLIAKEIGFSNAQEELDYLALSEEEHESDLDADPKDDREDYTDEEILDYAFLSETLVIRLREAAPPTADLELWLEVFEIPTSQNDASAPPSVLFKLDLPWEWGHGELSHSYLSTDCTFALGRCLSVCLHNTGASSLFLLDANKLRDHAMQNVTASGELEDCCYHSFDTDAPFLTQTGKHLLPTISNGTLLFPGYDLDPSSADPTAPLFRFVHFGKTPAHVVDIPLRSLLTLDDTISDFEEQSSINYGQAPFVVSWDGRKTLCVVFCWMTYFEPPSSGSRVWYVTLGPETLSRIGQGQ